MAEHKKNKTLLGKGILTADGEALSIANSAEAAVKRSAYFSVIVSGAAVAQNAYIYQEIIIPVGREVYLEKIEIFSSQQSVVFDIIEAPTITDGTSAVTPVNHNRNELTPAASFLTIFSDPTSISAGTTIKSKTFEISSISLDLLTVVRDFNLKSNTKYAIRLQNTDADNAVMYVETFWKEK